MHTYYCFTLESNNAGPVVSMPSVHFCIIQVLSGCLRVLEILTILYYLHMYWF